MPEVARLVWLDETDAQDPALVGAKASRAGHSPRTGVCRYSTGSWFRLMSLYR